MATRSTTRVVLRDALPYLVVIDQKLPGDIERRQVVCARKTFDAARSRCIGIREKFDRFFGEEADFWVMRVVDARDYKVLFEYW